MPVMSTNYQKELDDIKGRLEVIEDLIIGGNIRLVNNIDKLVHETDTNVSAA